MEPILHTQKDRCLITSALKHFPKAVCVNKKMLFSFTLSALPIVYFNLFRFGAAFLSPLNCTL